MSIDGAWKIQVKEGLLENGLDERDVRTALRIIELITDVDQKLFPGSEIPVAVAPERSPLHHVLSYHPKGSPPDGVERYVIYCPDLDQILVDRAKGILRLDKNGNRSNLPNQKPKILRNLALHGLAAHEIRHRVQHESSVKLYTPQDSRNSGWVGRTARLISGEIFPQYTKRLVQDGVGEEAIEHRTREVEFDAYVVETLVVHLLLHKNLKYDHFVSLIASKLDQDLLNT